jgi:hypothetical protein
VLCHVNDIMLAVPRLPRAGTVAHDMDVEPIDRLVQNFDYLLPC